MHRNFTPDHLLLALYHECEPPEAEALTQALRRDRELRDTYVGLARAQRALPQVTFQPARRVTDRILAYSRHAEIGREV